MQYLKEFQDDLRKLIKQINNYKELSNKKIFISGACGMIGSAIVDVLMYLNETEKCNISIIAGSRSEEKFKSRFQKYMDSDYLKYTYYEATAPLNIEKDCDYVIHAAGSASPITYALAPVEVMQCNIWGMNNILEYAKQNKTKRVMYISSSEVYGEYKSELPLVEDRYGFIDFLQPRMCYPSSKRATETLCVSYAKEYGVNVVISRPGHIYGPTALRDDSKASSQFARIAQKKENIILKSAGRQIRSYCYVYDCASAVLSILINGVSGEAYNISNKNSICSIRQLAEMFATVSGSKVVFENPSNLDLQASNPMDNSSLDASKLETLGWKGIFDLREGVEKTINYMD